MLSWMSVNGPLGDWASAFATFLAALIALAVALFGYFEAKSERRQRKRNESILGMIIADALLEEVETGLTLMRGALAGAKPTQMLQPLPLPYKSWDGMNTIPDHVLLRLVAIENSIPKCKRSNEGFPLREIRTHCKNYFEHIRVSVSTNLFPMNILSEPEYNYIGATEAVYKMLKEASSLCKSNSTKWFPA